MSQFWLRYGKMIVKAGIEIGAAILIGHFDKKYPKHRPPNSI